MNLLANATEQTFWPSVWTNYLAIWPGELIDQRDRTNFLAINPNEIFRKDLLLNSSFGVMTKKFSLFFVVCFFLISILVLFWNK